MKVTCPACSAKYTISDDRLNGCRVRARCKKCGEAFVVDPIDHPAENAPLIGARNEGSVLFSLAALGASVPQPAVAATTSEPSSLIDIRALRETIPKADAPSSRAEDIMNLSGGGAFGAIFAAPILAPPPIEEAAPARPANVPLAMAVVGAVALVASGVAVALVVTKTRAPREDATSASAPVVIAAPSPPATAEPSASSVPSAPPTVSSSARVSASPRPTSTAARTAPSARSATTSAAAVTTKCCPGESDVVCHMRLSVGAPCGDAPFGRVTPSGDAAVR